MPGALFLITGLHTGIVEFAVQLHDDAPAFDGTWEEIVEVPFRPTGPTQLVGWAGEWAMPLDLTGIDYRIRYCATGMDQGRARDTRGPDDPQADRYLLQFWPARPEPDRVIKQTSAVAAYWHGFARQQPAPPTP